LLSDENIEVLVERKGICVVYTHFGSRFVEHGEVISPVKRALKQLAGHEGGLFVPATELLDALCRDAPEPAPPLPAGERRRMELAWLRSKLAAGGTS
jgi:hypothetical protein